MTERLPATPTGIASAAECLRGGGLVAFGTETVYGLGADATNEGAVARIFAAKGRPLFNPLISHFPTAEQAFRHVVATALAETLSHHFWPGPLTLVMARRQGGAISDLATAGLATAAVRVPASESARLLLAATDRPIAAPSANPSGAVSPSTADHVMDGLGGRIDAVLDTGPCPVGVESTVLDISGNHPVLLRHGGIPVEAIEAVIGPVTRPDARPDGATPLSPGMLASHYAPDLPLRLDAESVASDEALLAFGTPVSGAELSWNLSERGDLEEAAARLFSGLRFLDAEGRARGLKRIAAQTIPSTGLGAAITDRLQRAAAPRPRDPSSPQTRSGPPSMHTEAPLRYQEVS